MGPCHPGRAGYRVVGGFRAPLRGWRWGGGNTPNRAEGEFVNVANLSQCERRFRGPVTGLQGLAIDPLRRCGVAGHFHILLQLLVPNSAPLGQECLDLRHDERVALQGGGMVGFLMPDRGPDALGLDWRRQAAHALSEVGDCLLEALVDELAGRAPSRRFVVFHHI